MKFNLLTIIALVICIGCKSSEFNETQIEKIEGPIDQITVGEFEAITDEGQTILFNSLGGKPSSALEISHLINQQDISIVVDFICASACIEYVLPAAQGSKTRALEFRDEPLIAFHWNAALIESVVRKNLNSDISHCPFTDTEELKHHQQKSNVNPSFWKTTRVKLGKNNSEYALSSSGCPLVKLKFENKFWLPTSRTLKNDFRLKFKGKVCADDIEKCKLKIDENWIKGTRIVIGDVVYISKGSDA